MPLDASLCEVTQARAVSQGSSVASWLHCIDLKKDRGKSNIAGVSLKNCSLVTVLSSNYAKTGSLLPSFKVGGEHIITALTSQTELPFSHGMLLRLFASFDYKNDSQVFEDNCRQGHC